jgi:hypothetical protein
MAAARGGAHGSRIGISGLASDTSATALPPASFRGFYRAASALWS